MNFTVFYAWQSDLHEKSNRYLIRDAAQSAVRELGRVEESPRVDEVPFATTTYIAKLDHDTKGVSGMADIPGTIFRKVEECGVFLADVTFVNSTGGGKPLPNSNVVLELGYAARSIGWDRIVCVMNEAYGSAGDLIFDLRHRRWPITYTLKDPSEEERRKVRDTLASRLREAIQAVQGSEYLAAEDAVAALSTGCIQLLKEMAPLHYSVIPIPDTTKVMLGNDWRNHAIDRLLDLKLIRLDVTQGISPTTVAYSMTYRGDMVLKMLGLRT